MTRKKRSPSPSHDHPELNLSSLVDVCFLLLIYFLITSQIIRKENDLSTALPSYHHFHQPIEQSPLILLIEDNGSISIRNEAGSLELVEPKFSSPELPTLSQRLLLHRDLSLTSGHKALVKVKVSGQAKQQRVTDVLNALAGAKITEIIFLESSS